MSLSILRLLVLLPLLLVPGLALADDWVAAKLRGKVLELVDGAWQPLARGDRVPDTHAVRTLARSRVLLVRGKESIELGPETLVQIYDRDGQQFTTVKQAFGMVTIEADVRNVEHFAVETPFMAAVVKGTRFEVRSGKSGSQVVVKRGHVAVESEVTHSTVVLAAGQSAISGQNAELVVAGSGVLPTVAQPGGVPAAETKAAEKATKEAEKAAAKAEQAMEKAAKETEKAAEEAEKATEKAENKAEKAGEKTARK